MSSWPARCTLMGCPRPDLRPHHHHMVYGHITTVVCQCPQRDQPGTSSRHQGHQGDHQYPREFDPRDIKLPSGDNPLHG